MKEFADKEVQEVIKAGRKAHISLEKASQKGRYDRLDAEIKINVIALESALERIRVARVHSTREDSLKSMTIKEF